jgi:crotonobetainyl-CoA hydratase
MTTSAPTSSHPSTNPDTSSVIESGASQGADSPAVLTERHGHVLVVTINRPEARNAINRAVTIGLGDALEEAEHDRDIWAVIVTGAGDTAFCAGADLKAVARGENIMPTEEPRASWGFAGYVSHHISKPTIAAVNGFALGGGTEITLASDLAVAADTASFGLPEVKRGIYAGAGGAFRLPQQLPKKIAMEMVLTGEPIAAQRAHELGLINRVVPREDLLDAALELAGRITVNAPLAVQASKRIANGIVDGRIAADTDLWALNNAEGNALMTSRDAAEGPRAFAEKRQPNWEAR